MSYANMLAKIKENGYFDEYVAQNGHKCVRIFGTIPYFYHLCALASIDGRWTGDFTHEADSGNGWGITFCEEDIILWKE